jgi:hypothetical protein
MPAAKSDALWAPPGFSVVPFWHFFHTGVRPRPVEIQPETHGNTNIKNIKQFHSPGNTNRLQSSLFSELIMLHKTMKVTLYSKVDYVVTSDFINATGLHSILLKRSENRRETG